MTSKPLEGRVSAVFDYWDAYVGGEKIKTDGLKRHTRTDVITHTHLPYLIQYIFYICLPLKQAPAAIVEKGKWK